MIKYAAFMPHPPIMIQEIGGSECQKIAETINSQVTITKDIQAIEAETDLLIVMSPHAPAARTSIPIYISNSYSGNLGNFGHPDLTVKFKGSDKETTMLTNYFKDKIAITTEPFHTLDHGIIVPLFELAKANWQKPIVFTGLNMYQQADHYKFGRLLTEYAQENKKNIIFIGSGDMSHALKDDGPYNFHPAGPKFDEKIVDLIKTEKEAAFLEIDPSFQEDAAECGFRSLLTIAGIRAIEQKLKPEVLSYEGPFGVGYLTARWK